jgi:ADP-heptose:LPS heptosyltransferase
MSLPNHILIIRLSALGDIAMTVPVLRVLAATYPNVKLTMMSRKYAKPLFDDIAGMQFLEADVKGAHKGVGLLKLATEARSLGIDAVADLHNVIRSKVIRNYLSISGIKSSVIDKGRAEKKLLTSGDPAWFKPLKSTHQRYADVFASLGLPLDLNEHKFPEPRTITTRIANLLDTKPLKAIGIAPFAAYKSKTYPFALMRQLLVALNATGRFKLYLFGGGREEIEQLKQLQLEIPNAINVAGQLTLEEELALISNLDLMLSMDSSNGHLAAMFGIPVVTLWGVTHPFAGFTPFQQPESNQLLTDRKKYPLIPTSVYGNKFPEGYDTAMTSIPVDTIVEKILDLV